MDYRNKIREKFVPKLRKAPEGKYPEEKEEIVDNGLQRTEKSQCERKIKERIFNLLETKYKDIIAQQEGDIHPTKYKPMLTKFFSKGKNINHLVKDLKDLEIEYEQHKGIPFKSFVQNILYSLEMSKIGAQLDSKVTENVMTYKEFTDKKV
jgi:hypothetical protein